MSENANIEWYVAHTYSGYENKVKATLEKTVENDVHLQDKILEVVIPEEEVIEEKNGKRRLVKHKLLPGYVMVRMEMTNETWYVVRNTRGVTGFVGANNKPIPLSETDFASVFAPSKAAERVDIHIGDVVRILSGMFADLEGKVSSIEADGKRLHVLVNVLGRETDVELATDEVIRDL